MIWVVCKHGGEELVIRVNKALAEEGLKSGLYLRKATKYDLSALPEWKGAQAWR